MFGEVSRLLLNSIHESVVKVHYYRLIFVLRDFCRAVEKDDANGLDLL